MYSLHKFIPLQRHFSIFSSRLNAAEILNSSTTTRIIKKKKSSPSNNSQKVIESDENSSKNEIHSSKSSSFSKIGATNSAKTKISDIKSENNELSFFNHLEKTELLISESENSKSSTIQSENARFSADQSQKSNKTKTSDPKNEFLSAQNSKQLSYSQLKNSKFLNNQSKNSDSSINQSENVRFTADQSETSKNSKNSINNSNVFRNPAGIQMISDDLYRQLFKNSERARNFPPQSIAKIKSQLSAHSLWGKNVENVPPISFKLPQLEGETIDEHFRIIASSQTKIYRELMDELTKSKLVKMPQKWAFEEGWTKYSGNKATKIEFPDADALVFDIEVCVRNGHAPTMACALSKDAWYSWCSSNLIKGIERRPSDKITTDDLIPFESFTSQTETCELGEVCEKIIIGHNVSYDRARIKEQYFINETKLRFMDTMSLHIALSGITSYQRALKMSMKNGLDNLSREKKENLLIAGSLEWNDMSSLNNLRDVYKLYCKDGKILEKEKRNIFVKGTLNDIIEDFQNLMSYCASDVSATFELFSAQLPIFYERFPHPVTLGGMLEMGQPYLPINSRWGKYIENSEKSYRELEKEIQGLLVKKANEALQLLDGQKYKKDPWLWDLDWKVTKPRLSKNSKNSEKFCKDNANCTSQNLPAWYKKLFHKSKKEESEDEENLSKISTSMRIVPKILRMCWHGFPLHFSKEGGWGYLVSAISADKNEKNVKVQESYYEAVDADDLKNVENLEKIESLNDENIENFKNEKEEEGSQSQFPYDEWVQIFESNKKDLISRVYKNSQNSTNIGQLEGDLRKNSEEIAQELKDFVKGLQSISTIGLRKGKRGKVGFVKKIERTSPPHPKCEFIPLPHKDGDNFRVGNPLAKDFLNKIEDGTLSSYGGDEDIANRVVTLSKMISYWRNNRDRIMGQMTVWHPKNETYGAILPQVTVCGTLTRRAVERTWMTASNALKDRVGSELKSALSAPPPYYFIGADVDSEELWIASVIGDADYCGVHGSTPLGWMTLQGDKKSGTDMHSKTAGLIGIGRDEAKILNYGRIYGAGVTFAERLLRQFNHSLTPNEARIKARTMYKMTKGQRKYLLNEEGRKIAEGLEEYSSKSQIPLSKDELFGLLKSLHYPPINYMDIVKRVVWDEGSESAMFNRLEEIASMELPLTPILGSAISRSLTPSVVHDDFMTSRINWVVQSSAVDYLHLMLVSMRWLCEKYKIQARFSISIHDEVRYLVKSEDRYRGALALQITNLLTRSITSYNLGLGDLPQSVAFFSSVEIDKILRKDGSDDCITPSNPEGIFKNSGIANGESLSIEEILKLTNNGSFS